MIGFVVVYFSSYGKNLCIKSFGCSNSRCLIVMIRIVSVFFFQDIRRANTNTIQCYENETPDPMHKQKYSTYTFLTYLSVFVSNFLFFGV